MRPPRDPASRPRDRDSAGRPRNARARDELGRPLPRNATSAAGDVPQIPDDLVVTPAEATALGGGMLAEGRPFHAHEVFEAAWKSSSGPERELWRGLAQIAVGLTHARRGNARGAERVRGYAAGPGRRDPDGVDAEFVAASADNVAARIERDGLSAVAPADLSLTLC